MRAMNVRGLTLFHLKSHLQKFRLGKQSVKDISDAPKDGLSDLHLLHDRGLGNSPSNVGSQMNEGHEVNEALKMQMELQTKLHVQVEAEKRLKIRQDAEKKYLAMLDRACKMLGDQYIGSVVTESGSENIVIPGCVLLRSASVDPLGYDYLQATEMDNLEAQEMMFGFCLQRTDCSTESCLTSNESLGGLTTEAIPVGEEHGKFNVESAEGSLVLGDMKTPINDASAARAYTLGITRKETHG